MASPIGNLWVPGLPGYITPTYTITFVLGATSYSTDGDGNPIPDDIQTIDIPVRLKAASKSKNQQQIERAFPGTDAHQILLIGWVNGQANPEFPIVLRRQGKVEGTTTYKGMAGRIEVSIGAETYAAQNIGERFFARFTPDQ